MESAPQPLSPPPEVAELCRRLAEAGLRALPSLVGELSISNSDLAALFHSGFPAAPEPTEAGAEAGAPEPTEAGAEAGAPEPTEVGVAAGAPEPTEEPYAGKSRELKMRAEPPFTDLALRAAIVGLPGFELPTRGPVPNTPYHYTADWAAGLCSRCLHLHFADPGTWRIIEYMAGRPWGLAAVYDGLPPTTAHDTEPPDDKLEKTLAYLETLRAQLDDEGKKAALAAARRNCGGWGYGPDETARILAVIEEHLNRGP